MRHKLLFFVFSEIKIDLISQIELNIDSGKSPSLQVPTSYDISTALKRTETIRHKSYEDELKRFRKDLTDPEKNDATITTDYEDTNRHTGSRLKNQSVFRVSLCLLYSGWKFEYRMSSQY